MIVLIKEFCLSASCIFRIKGTKPLNFHNSFGGAPPFMGKTGIAGGAFLRVYFSSIKRQAVFFFGRINHGNRFLRAL